MLPRMVTNDSTTSPIVCQGSGVLVFVSPMIDRALSVSTSGLHISCNQVVHSMEDFKTLGTREPMAKKINLLEQ